MVILREQKVSSDDFEKGGNG